MKSGLPVQLTALSILLGATLMGYIQGAGLVQACMPAGKDIAQQRL